MSKRLQGCIMLFIATLIWGASFVAQKAGMDHVGPHTFNCARATIAAIVLIPLIIYNDRKKNRTAKTSKEERNTLLFHSVINGIILFGIMTLQQVGMVYTDAGKAAFITAMYIVLVPIFGLFLRQKMRVLDWLCVVLATFGLYYLCIPAGSGFSLGKGDLLVLLCSVLCAVQIHTIAGCSEKVDQIRFACYQFVVMAVLSAIPMFIFETPTVEGLMAGIIPVLYAGVLSSGVAFTLQIIALGSVPPMAASFITSLESVFGVFTGILILGESLVMREALGCIIMFVAIMLAQIPAKNSESQAAETVDKLESQAEL